MAPVKEYFATLMLSASERFPKEADSASVEMVGRETVEHVPVRLNRVYKWNKIGNAHDGKRLQKTLNAQHT